MFAGDDFPGGLDDELSNFGFQLTEIPIRYRRRQLHQSERADKANGQRFSGDRKVLDGTLGLSAVISLGRHSDLAHGIFFDTELAHRTSSRRLDLE